MTKRDIKTIFSLYKKGLSLDVCRTAIIQQCCPSITHSDVNSLSNALQQFDELREELFRPRTPTVESQS